MTARLETRETSDATTLLVVGDTLHFRDEQGRYCTHGALARQLDQWFAAFDHVVIAAVLEPGPVPEGFSPYEHQTITFAPLARAGGTGLKAKVGALRTSVSWARTVVPLLRQTDAVHLRAPCNVTVVAIPLARLLARRRYAIYAGAWDPPPGTPFSYRLQRWMLRHFGGVVHVYAPAASVTASNLRPNFSPSFTVAKLDQLEAPAAERLDRIRSSPPSERPLRVCCIGRFTTNKNQAALVEAAGILRDRDVHVEIRFAGDGPTRPQLEERVRQLGLEERVTFLGRQAETEVEALYGWADVNVMPSHVEGFGRVILEGMALGCPAVCGPGPMQLDLIGDGSRGYQVDPSGPVALADTLDRMRVQPVDRWVEQSTDCRRFARERTIEAWGLEVQDLLEHDLALGGHRSSLSAR